MSLNFEQMTMETGKRTVITNYFSDPDNPNWPSVLTANTLLFVLVCNTEHSVYDFYKWPQHIEYSGWVNCGWKLGKLPTVPKNWIKLKEGWTPDLKIDMIQRNPDRFNDESWHEVSILLEASKKLSAIQHFLLKEGLPSDATVYNSLNYNHYINRPR
jgi:hypothetical protein